SPFALFTNDDLFRKLGLTLPRTFPQLLRVCRQATAAGTAAFVSHGGALRLVETLAIGTLYGRDKSWAGKLRAGKVTFAGTPGWRQALQHVVDMNSAGCFPPGATTAPSASVLAQFLQGRGLILPGNSADKGFIDAGDPHFAYSFHPLPNAADPGQAA